MVKICQNHREDKANNILHPHKIYQEGFVNSMSKMEN